MKNKYLKTTLITLSIIISTFSINVFARPTASFHSSSFSSGKASSSNSYKPSSFSNSTNKIPSKPTTTTTNSNTYNKSTNINVNKNTNINNNKTVIVNHNYNSYGGYSGNFWSNYFLYRAITHTQPVYVSTGHSSSSAYKGVNSIIYDVISFIILIAVIIGLAYVIRKFIKNRRRF